VSLSLTMKERAGTKMDIMNDGPYRHVDIIDKARINNAAYFARKAHNGQTRKGSEIPFFVHPMKVANTVQIMGGTIPQIQAAFLHDTVEDTDTKLIDIRKNFTEEVEGLVAALSEDKSLPTWHERKVDYYEKISAADSRDAILISLADKMDNLNDTYYEWCIGGDDIFDKFNASKSQQSWFYRTLIDGVYYKILKHTQPRNSTRDLTHIMSTQLSAMGM